MIAWTVCSVTSGNRRQTVTMRSDGRQTDCCDLRDQCIISCCRHRRRRTRSYGKSALPCTSSVHICETAWSDTAVQVCSPWQTDTQLSVSNRHRSAVIGQLCLLSWPQDVSHRPVPYRAGPFHFADKFLLIQQGKYTYTYFRSAIQASCRNFRGIWKVGCNAKNTDPLSTPQNWPEMIFLWCSLYRPNSVDKSPDKPQNQAATATFCTPPVVWK